MSVFRVNFSNADQGQLDVDPTTGVALATSIQRTMMITGPKNVQRQLKDGETFTDSNYYKRYAFQQVSLEEAILEVETDDGSVFSDIPSENTFPVTWLPGANGDGDLVDGDTWTDTNMSRDIVAVHGGPAVFVQINNNDDTAYARVRLNGTAIFSLAPNSSQIFNNGDLQVTKIEFDNTFSGGLFPGDGNDDFDVSGVEVILSVRSVSNS